MRRHLVTATDDQGNDHSWDCDSLDAAKELLSQLGVHGFFLDERAGVACEFIAPGRIRRLYAMLHPALMCKQCGKQEKQQGSEYCASSALEILCEHCQAAERKAGSRYCSTCEYAFCGRCHVSLKLKKELYCKECKKEVLQEMRTSGYLQEVPHPTPSDRFRPRRTQPLHQGDWDNAVRSVEGDT